MSRPTSRAEAWWLAALLALFSVVALACLRVFSVHLDEPSYTDPAASYALGQGFTSGAWYGQTHDQFWAGNVPLYQFILVVWFKVFGFSQLAVRSISVFFAAAGIALLWIALKRTHFLNAPAWRLGFAAFLLCSFGTTQMLVVGRPDAMTFLLICAAYWAITLKSPRGRCGGLALIGFLAPWAGLQVATLLAFLGVLLLIFWQRRFVPEIAAVACGGVLGTGTLLGLYAATRTLDAFLASIRHHTAARDAARSAAFSALSHRAGAFHDPSFILLIGAVAVMLAGCLIHPQTRKRFPECLVCLTALLGIPGWMIAVGIFPVYYSWMAVLPVGMCLFHLLESGFAGRGVFRAASVALVILATAMGAPRIFGDALIHWTDRVNAKTEEFVKSALHPGDVAMISRQAYYPAKQLSRRVYYAHWYMDVITEQDQRALTVAIMDRESFASVGSHLGGTWRPTGESLSLPPRNLIRSKWFTNHPMTDLTVFRKVEAQN